MDEGLTMLLGGFQVTVKHWGDADKLKRQLADYLCASIQYGHGNVTTTGNMLLVCTKDYESGDGRGYRFYHLPMGDGYKMPVKPLGSIEVTSIH